MKKKIIILFVFIILFWIWKDFKKIDIYFINQNAVTYSFENLNNNYLKKIYIKTNNLIENYFITYLDKHKNYWQIENQTNRKSYLFKIIPKKKFDNICNLKVRILEFKENLNSASQDASKQINQKSIKSFSLVFEAANEANDIQANPLFINNDLYSYCWRI